MPVPRPPGAVEPDAAAAPVPPSAFAAIHTGTVDDVTPVVVGVRGGERLAVVVARHVVIGGAGSAAGGGDKKYTLERKK